MILETLSLVTSALADSDIGINAQIATLSVLPGHQPPDDVVFIEDEANDFSVSFRKAPEDTSPAVLVTLAAPVTLGGSTVADVRTLEVPVTIAVLENESRTDKAMRNVYYIMRAIEKTLTAG